MTMQIKFVNQVPADAALSTPETDLERRKRLHKLTTERVKASMDTGLTYTPSGGNCSPHNRRA